MTNPSVVVLAGPNGAGKSTAAPRILRGSLSVSEFVNADTIAQGLSAFAPESAALTAGRIMLSRLHELAAEREDFAFETTMASRSFAPWLKQLVGTGYAAHLVFLWLPSPEMAVSRVKRRVELGGHSVPRETIIRRYNAGLRNFFRLYQPIATSWRFYDNSRDSGRLLVAYGGRTRQTVVRGIRLWNSLTSKYFDDRSAQD